VEVEEKEIVMTADGILLRQYAETGLEEAFSELVQRHLPLVYSAALRQLQGNEALAKDVAQTVFIDLAHKAKSLSNHELLAGWLYSATRLAAFRALRGERRRQRREQIAAGMQTINSQADTEQTELAAVLDSAMSKLASADRNVLILRFFSGKTLKEVGLQMGLSEDAARMKVTRALEKLQKLIGKRGVVVPIAVLGSAITAETIQAAPAGLAGTISAVAVTSAGANAGFVGILKILTAAAKTKAGIVSVALIAGGLAVILVEKKMVSERVARQVHFSRRDLGFSQEETMPSAAGSIRSYSVKKTEEETYPTRRKRSPY
jgi:RNA polymerase sigma factor (sigma-70 family)